jgi:pimeloyl-ACP methyl ester carboxylesterase
MIRMGPIALSFDVTDKLSAELTGGRATAIAAWLFLPDDLTRLSAKPVVMTLLAGGTYDKRYFHVQIPGRTGYSAAEHLAALGNIVLVPDHLGVGESTRPAHPQLATRGQVALANHAAVTQFAARLRAGKLHPGLPAIQGFQLVGAGHSMGAMQTITQQAEYETHHAIMVLGYTADAVHLTIGGKTHPAYAGPPSQAGPDYTPGGGREPLHETFHWPDVPADVVAADDRLAVETPAVIGFASITPGVVSEDAARIKAPVYICLGERDVSPNPHLEPSYYKNSPDITLQILPRSGHCQNFASTRHVMWNRMHDWASRAAL